MFMSAIKNKLTKQILTESDGSMLITERFSHTTKWGGMR